MADLCVFTTGTNLDLLHTSARRVGIKVATYDCAWKGYVTGKLREGVKFLETRTEPFAMWVDGNDSLILKPEAVILERAPKSGVLISAEHTCWPDSARGSEYPLGLEGCPRFINAGGFIGPRGEVLTAMRAAIEHAKDEDDQRAWTSAYLAGAIAGLAIDYERRIFHSMGDGDPVGDSCVAHWNGKIPGMAEWWRAWCSK